MMAAYAHHALSSEYNLYSWLPNIVPVGSLPYAESKLPVLGIILISRNTCEPISFLRK